jgi:hypothetical protein
MIDRNRKAAVERGGWIAVDKRLQEEGVTLEIFFKERDGRQQEKSRKKVDFPAP